MADLQFYDSQLYNEDIESTLVQLRRIKGHIKGNGFGKFFTSSGGNTEIYIKNFYVGQGVPVILGEEDNDLYIDTNTGYLYRYDEASRTWIEISYAKNDITINNYDLTEDRILFARDISFDDSNLEDTITNLIELLNNIPDGNEMLF